MNKRGNTGIILIAVIVVAVFAISLSGMINNNSSVRSITGCAAGGSGPSCYGVGDITESIEEGRPRPGDILDDGTDQRKLSRFKDTEKPEDAPTDVKLEGTKEEVLDKADDIFDNAKAPKHYGQENLDTLSQRARDLGEDEPVTMVMFETNGYRTPDGATDVNELKFANEFGHGKADNVVQRTMDQFDNMGDEIVKRYNDVYPEAPIKRVEGYTREGTRGTGVAFLGDVDQSELKKITQEVIDEYRPRFLDSPNVPPEVSKGEITGIRASVGKSDSLEAAHQQASAGFGRGTKKDGTDFGVKGESGVVTYDEIDFRKPLILDYTRQAPGIDTPDETGKTLRQQYLEARDAYNSNPTKENLAKFERVTNEINFRANAHPASGAPNFNYARQNVKQSRPLSSGGEENFIVYKTPDGRTQYIFSDVDDFGSYNLAKNDGGVAGDAQLKKSHQITQDILDESSTGEPRVVTAPEINKIRKANAEELEVTRSYAAYNDFDGFIPGTKADPNVQKLAKEGQYDVPGFETPVTRDRYNEMVIGIGKEQPGKNTLVVLESLSDDGTSGTVRIYNDNLPEGRSFSVVFDPESSKASIVP